MVFLTVFLDLVGFGIVIPLLPLYAERFGADPLAVAALVAVHSLAQFFLAPLWGGLSDRVGRRPVLLAGLFGSAATYALMGAAGSLAVLFVARVLSGATGATVGVAQAYVADLTRPEERARGLGMIGAAFGLGFVLGPAIGGALAPFGPAVPFLGAAALTLANAIAAVFLLPESLPPGGVAAEGRPPATLAGRMRALSDALARPTLRAAYLGAFLVTFAFAALEATLSLWAARRWELGPTGVALLFTYLGVVSVVAQGVLVGRAVRRLGERGAALLGLAAMGVAFAGLAVAPSLAAAALALAAFGVGQGIANPALSALVSRTGGAADQGRLLGVSQSVSALARMTGPLWGGFALARLGLAAPFVSGAVLAVVGMVAVAGGVPRLAPAARG